MAVLSIKIRLCMLAKSHPNYFFTICAPVFPYTFNIVIDIDVIVEEFLSYANDRARGRRRRHFNLKRIRGRRPYIQYRSVFSEISAHGQAPSCQGDYYYNTVFGLAAANVLVPMLGFSLCTYSSKFLQFIIVRNYCTSWCTRFGGSKVLLSIFPFPARLLALVSPARSLGVIREKCYRSGEAGEAVSSGGSEFGAVKSCRS